jgi:hypothetical protein
VLHSYACVPPAIVADRFLESGPAGVDVAYNRRIFSALFALVALLLTSQGAGASSDQILERAGRYVREFEDAFAIVVSDEQYEQKAVVLGDGGRRLSGETRRIQSEMLFAWLPEQQSWMTARNVLAVNRSAVPDSKYRIDAALMPAEGSDRRTRLRRLRDEGARFNLGRIYRNFNDPTLVLQFLDPVYQPRFTFAVLGTDKVNGVEAWKLSFTERVLPTVIQTPTIDLPSSGVVWIEHASGAVARTTLTLTDSSTNMHAQITVEYRFNSKLGVTVPTRMTEEYTQTILANMAPAGEPQRVMTVRERIECVATYSNFRRFETTARMIVPR